ncbi:hypothetical protein ACHHYP_04550 [Achlya hypogyna]|uniref:Uncharacterized protein n=1 Tax=Achlya hypogyna TaxID=1202772 RepID=A0A1V9Z0N6_ACHHY|nr:hypothetical protein ACHHYP_04550 [Achlya hypogyna]
MLPRVALDELEAPRRDQRAPCQQCHSDVNAKLLVHCPQCALRRHTYCFRPPLLGNPSWRNPGWRCPRCTAASPPQAAAPLDTPLSSLEFAKRRALPLPKTRKPAPTSPTLAAQLSAPPPRAIPTLEGRAAGRLRRVALAWLRYRRQHAPSPVPRPQGWHRRLEGRATRSVMHELTLEEEARLGDWRLKYVEAPENDDMYRPRGATPPAPAPEVAEDVEETPPECVPAPEVAVPSQPVTAALAHNLLVAGAKGDAVKRRKQQRHVELIQASRESQMARRLQRWVRRWLGAAEVARRKAQAATVIAYNVRAYLDRVHRRAAKASAVRLLQAQRAKDAKAELHRARQRERARRRIGRFCVTVALPVVQLRRHSAVRLQATWRRFHCRKAYLANPRQRGALRIQTKWRQHRAKRIVYGLRHAKARCVLSRFVQRWHVRRLLRTEKKRLALLTAARALGVIDFDAATATPAELFTKLGFYYFNRRDHWIAAACFDRAVRNGGPADCAMALAMAASHHATWYQSCDDYNLVKAYELYKAGLALDVHRRDPHAMYDFALVLVERREYSVALELLGHVLSLYPTFELAATALLWTGVVLLHLHRADESLRCFSQLLDAPPPPFSAADATVLCALSYHAAGRAAEGKTGLATALALARTAARQKKLSSTEMLVDLGRRALQSGQYLLAYEVFFYGLRRAKHPSSEAWLLFAETLRHVGELADARQALDAAVGLDPTNSRAITALAQWPPATDAFSSEFLATSDVARLQSLASASLG